MTLNRRTSFLYIIIILKNNLIDMSQKIRIKLKSYDHKLVDKSAEKIVKAVKATGAIVSGPIPLQPTSASSPLTEALSLTRRAVNNFSCKISSALSTSIAQRLRP